MGSATHVVLSTLTLITVIIASDVADSTSNSAASLSQYQPDSRKYVVNTADYQNVDSVANRPADMPVFPLSLHAREKTSRKKNRKSLKKARKRTRKSLQKAKKRTRKSLHKAWKKTRKSPQKAGKRNHKSPKKIGKRKPRARARSRGGVTATATSSGTLVIASNTKGKRCVTIKKPCGTTCSRNSKSIGMCSGGSKPKYCFKTKKLLGACPGKRLKMCKETKKVPYVCKKKVRRKVRCPGKVGKRTVCAYPKVPTYSCKELPTRCAKIGKKKCRYRTTHQKFPCRQPTRTCKECFKNTAFKKCKATITKRVEVPCNGPENAGPSASVTPRPHTTTSGTNTRAGPLANSTVGPATPATPSASPSASTIQEVDFFDEQGGYDSSGDGDFDEFNSAGDFDNFGEEDTQEGGEFDFGESSAIPINFGGAEEQTRSVACFASLFNECDLAPAYCQLFDDAFDSDRCTRQVCRECGLVKNMKVGRELKEYCKDLSASCHFFSRMLVTRMMTTAAVARSSVEKSEETKKCYKNETKTLVLPCNYQLPKSEVCIKGCRIGRCEKIGRKRVSKYCRDHLPKNCYQKCERKMVKRKVCHTLVEPKPSKRVCKKNAKVKRRCYKKKTVKKPCKGQTNKLCGKLKKVQYICGKITSKIGKCTGAKGERKCKTKMCVEKKCS